MCLWRLVSWKQRPRPLPGSESLPAPPPWSCLDSDRDRAVVHLMKLNRFIQTQCTGPQSSAKQNRCHNGDGSLLLRAGFRFQREALSLGSQGRGRQGGCEDIRTVTKITIFGHDSALGSSGVQGSLGLITVCPKRNNIHCVSNGETILLNLFVLKQVAAAKVTQLFPGDLSAPFLD